VVHPQARDHLEQPQRLFPLAPAVDHHRHGPEVHAVGGEEQQVRRHAVQLGQQHADPLGPGRDVAVDAEQRLGGQGEDQLVVERRRVVHAGDVRRALQVGERLAGLLHAGVQVADDRLGPQHRLALELEHEPQHAVRRRVHGAHVDDHRRLVVVGHLAGERGRLGLGHPQHRADLAQDLAGVGPRAGPHLLGALGGVGGREVGGEV
jgi:hypothetical protein